MSFVHPLLLGGLLLVGIPVLIHLIMQQKPRHLLFPAFRFLVQKHRTNQRRLRLRHLLLLALRMLLIAAICLALARPKLFSEGVINIGSDRPVAAVLLFDTSLSMGYQVAGRTRLDDARQRALELLASLPDGSRIAILDSAEAGGEWLPNRRLAEERIAGLKLQPANSAVTRQIGQAYRLLNTLDQEQTDSTEPLPRFLYVFSDRTVACWDGSEARALHQPEGLNALFVDVGVDEPADLALLGVEVPRQVVNPGDRVEIRVGVRASGTDAENDLVCLLLGEQKGDRRPVKLQAGKSETKVFERLTAAEEAPGRLPIGLHQVELQLGNTDALPFNNVANATFKVEGGRRILIVADQPFGKAQEPGDATLWTRALRASHTFLCDVLTTKEANGLGKGELSSYRAVCLLNVANPGELWARLEDYVRDGNGLAVVPGGEEWKPNRDAYKAGRELLGAQLVDPVDKGSEPGALWKELEPEVPAKTLHPLMKPFRWAREDGFFRPETLPRARHYWKFQPDPGKAQPIATYADGGNWPALLERRLGKGHVLLFTTAMDGRTVQNRQANNFLESPGWVYPVLVNVPVGYLAGDADPANFNYVCGQPVTVPVPPSLFTNSLYSVIGPGLNGINVTREKGENQLRITQAIQPGNYVVLDPEGKRVAAFSLNVRPEESQLDRVPREDIEALLGSDSVLAVDRSVSLRDALAGHWLQPLEIFPWLMIFVLLVLAVENLLSNKFYRHRVGEKQESV
jgi:hypothetical protein